MTTSPAGGRLDGAKVLVALVLLGVAVALVHSRLGGRASPKPPASWPPVKGRAYPELPLEDHTGKPFKLSSLLGKVVLIEPIGMACPACNAYAGGDDKTGFRGAGVQPGVGSLETLLRRFGDVRLGSEQELVLVQLLLFDMSSALGNAPTREDASAWAKHFDLAGRANVVVVRGTPALADQAGYDLVPGFQLVDRKGVLRYDGSGHHPKDHPYETVLAAVPDLLRERP